MRLAFFALILSLISTNQSLGHEFWISPLKYQVEVGEKIEADIRIGQKFGGGVYAYIPNNFSRFDLVKGDETVVVEGRIGDRPALGMVAPGEGLWVVVHESTDNKLTWRDWEKFVGFVEHKDLGNTLERHAERGIGETGFSESYRRFAKSLIAVGDGQGTDQEMGLKTEFVAALNPYTDDLSTGFPVQVLLDGAPRADVQIEVFEKNADDEVNVFTARTDDQGRATIPVKPGHSYLLDSVTMLELEAEDPALEPVWRSLWAALTFAVPQ